ncbi:MAG TPA: hypothetical protein VGH86_10225 [Phenylobacterium sp.]
MANAPEFPEKAPQLWRLMQHIEYCRYRAEMAEAKSVSGSKTYQNEMVEIARQWRDLARTIERLNRGSG